MMKRTRIGLTAIALVLGGCVSISTSDQSYVAIEVSDEIEPIEAAVYDYFDGQGEASLERLNRAFHPDASMFGVTQSEDGEDTLRVWPKMSEVSENWASNPNPVGAGRDGEILNIDVVDDRIAVVTFRSVDRFYDALTLVKMNGEWKIASKVFVRQ